MRRTIGQFSFILALFFMSLWAFSFTSPEVHANDESPYDLVYFGSRFCSTCIALENDAVVFEDVAYDNIFDLLIAQGYNIRKYTLEDETAYTALLRDYQHTYDVPLSENQVPVIFVGETYLIGHFHIRDRVLDGTVQNIIATQSMLPVASAPASGFSLAYFILLGLVDGVNPCAIAMLLLFISLLSFTNKKRVLLSVAFTFILAIFISYFLFGTILYRYLSTFRFGSVLIVIVPWIIIALAGFLFLLNFYDFIITTKQRYDKVKNQLPRGIQKFNRRLMEAFTAKMEAGSPMIYVITFVIGLIVSFTEFLCTGQAYLTAILHLIHFTDSITQGMLLLLLYNLIFVLPLIIITLVAVKTQSVVSISAFMRERLHLIKLFNALVFLAIVVYYLIFII